MTAMIPPSSPTSLKGEIAETGPFSVNIPAGGTGQVPGFLVNQLMAQGWTLAPSTAPTGARPTTNLAAGVQCFDITLGKPIWRNAANTGWSDATGAGV